MCLCGGWCTRSKLTAQGLLVHTARFEPHETLFRKLSLGASGLKDQTNMRIIQNVNSGNSLVLGLRSRMYRTLMFVWLVEPLDAWESHTLLRPGYVFLGGARR